MRDAFTSEAVTPANEEEVLAEAFPAIDASEEEVARMAEVPPDDRLLEATPPPRGIDPAELEEEVAYTRVIVVRGRGIPVDKVISIGGALLLHALLVGGFLLALYFAMKLGVKGGGGGGMMARGTGGGPEGQYMIVGETPGPAEARSVADVLPDANPPALPEQPALPTLPDPSNEARQLVAKEDPRLTDDTMIGVASVDRVGSPRVPPPPPRVAETPRPTGVTVAPPPSVAKNSVVVASAGSTTAAPSRGGGGPGRGRGGDDDFGDETIIPLSKGEGGGIGGGSGGGSGSGAGRGASGANNPEPQILEWADVELPTSAALNPPKRPARFRVTVKADASVASIELLQSCGQSVLDEIWREGLRKNKYRPAYRAGKPYEAFKDIEMGPRK